MFSSVSMSNAKVLGGIGALLALLASVPNVGWLFGLAGFVMILLAIRTISRVVNDRGICTNMRNAVILGIGAIAVGGVTAAGAIYGVLGMGSFTGTRFVFLPNITVQDWFGLAMVVASGLIAMWVILVASAVMVRRSFSAMASRLNINTFKTAGLLYLIGAATAIIGVGLILLFIAEIVLAISFFSIKEDGQQQAVPQGTPAPTVSQSL
jgi:uncharacterized membrane protein